MQRNLEKIVLTWRLEGILKGVCISELTEIIAKLSTDQISPYLQVFWEKVEVWIFKKISKGFNILK